MMAHPSSQAAGLAAGLPALTNGDGLCQFPTAAVAMHRGRGGLESKFDSSQFRRRQVQDREVGRAGVSLAAEACLPPVSPRDLSSVGAPRHLLFSWGPSSDWASALPNGLIYLNHFFKGSDAVTFWGTGVRGSSTDSGGHFRPSKGCREEKQLGKAPGPLHRWTGPARRAGAILERRCCRLSQTRCSLGRGLACCRWVSPWG